MEFIPSYLSHLLDYSVISQVFDCLAFELFEVGVDMAEIGSTGLDVLTSIDMILVVNLSLREVPSELQGINDILLLEVAGSIRPFKRLRVNDRMLERGSLFYFLIVEHSHVLINGAADELIVAMLEMRLLLSIALPVDENWLSGRKTMPSDVLSIFNRCINRFFLLPIDFLLHILHRDAEPFIGHSVVPILYSLVKLLFCLDLPLAGQKVIVLNNIVFSLPVDSSILDDETFDVGIFGQHPTKQLYFCQLIKGLPVGLFLHGLEIPEILPPVLKGVVVFVPLR